ncbi:hypothetical protein THRCLA_21131 [Thraustotheca clavata]|uniref:Protein kinase domain-containing protein n=1 Tax=Thraustotheca clavata TaxID=74557 RepID=A0A1V9ZZW3_9STRA|nr:hypothetical protein THRCLA_21131 [Thraustotheca clavata]
MTIAAGTLWWTAPENPKEIIDYAADIYSFGVVLTQLDTLELPYHNVNLSNFAIMSSVLDGTLRPVDSCEPWYKNLVDKCLDRDPNKRPTAMEIVLILSARFKTKAKISFSDVASTQVDRLKQLMQESIQRKSLPWFQDHCLKQRLNAN